MIENDSIIVPRAVGEQMRCWLVGDDGSTHPEQRISDLEAVLGEARLQIEYLQEKFQPTGSGNAVLARINAALAGKL